ncbi:MAG: hypothetical protein K0S39_2230 [Paenibacillus sp.]|nr:hypothetical protein [Paenibacillus sp.]
MMQRINSSHLQELTDIQKEKLRKEWTPQEGEYIAMGNHEEMVYYLNGVEKHKSLPLLTIGQMIEHLTKYESSFSLNNISGEWIIQTSKMEAKAAELCHVLWEAFKSVALEIKGSGSPELILTCEEEPQNKPQRIQRNK